LSDFFPAGNKKQGNTTLLTQSIDSMNSSDSAGQHTYYTYITSCAKAPRLPGKSSFLDFSNKIGSSRGEASKEEEELPSVEAKTIFAMHKFELVD